MAKEEKTNFKIRINGNWFIVSQFVTTKHIKRLAKISKSTVYREVDGKRYKIKNSEDIDVVQHYPRYYLVVERFSWFKNLFR